MKRRVVLQLFGGTAVAVPLARNLQFEIEEDSFDLDGEIEVDDFPYDPPPSLRTSGPLPGDVYFYDNAMTDMLDYKDGDVFDCFPCFNNGKDFIAVSEVPGRNWSREIGAWGEMRESFAGGFSIHPTVEPTWEGDRDGYFRVSWMMVRNKTQDKPFARVYLGDLSNKDGDLTITWSVNGLATIG
jgi:hypothetical protein